MKEAEEKELPPLRFVIPLDGARASDRELDEIFSGVPNGMLGGLARLMLSRALRELREGTATVESLLLETMRDQADRKRLRGRPPGRKTRTQSPGPDTPATSSPRKKAVEPVSTVVRAVADVPAMTEAPLKPVSISPPPTGEAKAERSGEVRGEPEARAAEPATKKAGAPRIELGGLVSWT